MPTPPPAPRRNRAQQAQQAQQQNGQRSSANMASGPAGVDSSDDIDMRLLGGGDAATRARRSNMGFSDASSSFTFGPTARAAMPSSSRRPPEDHDALLHQLRGKSAGSVLRPPAGPSSPAAPQPKRNIFPPSSPFAPSRKGPGPTPSTPTGHHAGSGRSSAQSGHQDGSLSVLRDDDEANNSGLLELGPTSFKSLDFFGGGGGGGANGMRSRGGMGSTLSGRPSTQRDWAATTVDANGSIVEHSLSEVPEGDEDANEADMGEEAKAQLLGKLRLWRHDAMEHHLFDTAIFWGEKVFWMEENELQRPNDAYFLAKAYFLTHQYSRAQHLLTTPLPQLPTRAAGAKSEMPSSAPNGFQSHPEEDALEAALAGTRASSALPPGLLQRQQATSGFSSGAVPSGSDVDDEDADVEPEQRKRKDRDFTISGTGTGSEGNGGAASSVDGGSSDGRNSAAADSAPFRDGFESTDIGRHSKDFRMGSRKGRQPQKPTTSSDLPLPEPVYEAWKREQDDSLSAVRQAARSAGGQHSAGKALVDSSAACRFLAAKCLARLGKFGEALDLIGEETSRWNSGGKYGYSSPSSDGLLKVASSVCHLRGLIHFRLDNLDQAKEAFIEALRLDVKNYDAFATLVDGRLLSGPGEMASLLEGLQWQAQSAGDTGSFDFIKMCYTARLGKDAHEDAVRAAASRKALWDEFTTLQGSADLLCSLAQDLYSRRRYRDAFTVTTRILDLDPEHGQTIDLHVSCIASSPELMARERPRLFLLANRLVDEHPERASSWYAVGVWYIVGERWADARRYFSKATLLDPRHLPSWLCFAHSFSLEGESEQAILAYSSVVRNFPSVEHARVCVGSEHLRTGNLRLAHLFLDGGAGQDRFDGEEERGVLCYLEGNALGAIQHLERALHASEAIGEPQSHWLTTQLNLGWAYLKADRFDESVQAFFKAASLDAENVTACLGLAMARHKKGDLADAIGWYHEALAIEPRHPQATELLQTALDEYVESSSIQGGGGGGIDGSEGGKLGRLLGMMPKEVSSSDPLPSSLQQHRGSGGGESALGIGASVDQLSLNSRNSSSTSAAERYLQQVPQSADDSDSGMNMVTRVENSMRREGPDEEHEEEVSESVAMDETG